MFIAHFDSIGNRIEVQGTKKKKSTDSVSFEGWYIPSIIQYVIKILRSSGIKKISVFKNKFDRTFKHGKNSCSRNSPQNFWAEANRILLSSHLQAGKFESTFNTSNHMEQFSSQWNCFAGTQVWKTQKTVKTQLKISAEKSAERQVFWASRNCEPNRDDRQDHSL